MFDSFGSLALHGQLGRTTCKVPVMYWGKIRQMEAGLVALLWVLRGL